jgi:DNA invertase Pin-like site-specific DNA recombinase
LGLEGQAAAVEAYAKQPGQPIVAHYVEVESGKKDDRPELARALAHAKRSKATFCLPKLDRLGRRAAFLSFLAVKGPHAKNSFPSSGHCIVPDGC